MSVYGIKTAWGFLMSVFYLRVIHLFPFRTEKCSRASPMILAASVAGKVGYADIQGSDAVLF